MARRTPNHNPDTPPPPLDPAALERLALRYVERYATTRAKLASYLARKLRERGAAEGMEGAAEVERLVARVAELGYVNDRLFAETRGAALVRRGFGERRRREALRAAGIEPTDAAASEEAAQDADGWPSALIFARRRRIGPYADEPADPDRQRRQLAAMLRAGHGFAIARALVEAKPGVFPPDSEPHVPA